MLQQLAAPEDGRPRLPGEAEDAGDTYLGISNKLTHGDMWSLLYEG